MIAVTPVAAVDPARALEAARIAAALASPQHLGADGPFIGRIATRVFADDDVVVKRRVEYESTGVGPERWIEGRVARERRLGVYPADRTWFVLEKGPAGTRSVGCASLRRRPAHLWDDTELLRDWEPFIRGFIALYLRAAADGWRLDEGLSNFAWDDAGELRYLDDDLYTWDHGVSLAHALPVLARRRPVLGPEHGALLGDLLREALRAAAVALDTRVLASDLRTAASLDSRPAGGGFLTAIADRLQVRARSRRATAPGARIALLSDIHGNLAALDAVLAASEVRAADEILVLGDTVGYGPDPDACIERLSADPRVRAVLGNHDAAALDPAAEAGFSPHARWAITWTRAHLAPESRSWLSALPREIAGDGWLALHGAPADPGRINGYVYAMTADDNMAALELSGHRIGFHGHTHVAGAWVSTAAGLARMVPPAAPLVIGAADTVLACPGSVGQPRDRRPGAAFAIFHPREGRIEYGRAAYDLAVTAERMRAEGFPAELAARLARG